MSDNRAPRTMRARVRAVALRRLGLLAEVPGQRRVHARAWRPVRVAPAGARPGAAPLLRRIGRAAVASRAWAVAALHAPAVVALHGRAAAALRASAVVALHGRAAAALHASAGGAAPPPVG